VHVSFVCSGNICRSPIAALVFTEHLRRAGLSDDVRVTSAGIGGWHVGEPADPRAVQVLAEHNYPTDHIAARVAEDHLSADLVVAMDAGHETDLRALLADGGQVVMFRSFDPDAGDDLDVPDPYYGEYSGFVEVLGMAEAAMPALLDWVRANKA
jgi:protein-tyrosine phosphatase